MFAVPLVLRHDLATFKIETEADLLQPLLPHRVPELCLIGRIEHQKTSPTSADQFPSERAPRHGEIIPLVDLLVAHAGGADLLVQPVHVHQPGKFTEIASFQCHERLATEVLREMEIVEHGLVVLLRPVILILED